MMRPRPSAYAMRIGGQPYVCILDHTGRNQDTLCIVTAWHSDGPTVAALVPIRTMTAVEAAKFRRSLLDVPEDEREDMAFGGVCTCENCRKKAF